MKKQKLLALGVFLNFSLLVFSQQQYYDVTSGNGNGLRFWSSNNYKIHMGSAPNYRYGPVTDYSIKMNMNDNLARGWTWGVNGQSPIAALNTQGTMQLAKDLRVLGRIGIGTNSPDRTLVIKNTKGAGYAFISGIAANSSNRIFDIVEQGGEIGYIRFYH